MGNAVKYIRRLIGVTTSVSSDEQAKNYLITEIDKYIQERIVVADEAIVKETSEKTIQDGDVLLTFARFALLLSYFNSL